MAAKVARKAAKPKKTPIAPVASAPVSGSHDSQNSLVIQGARLHNLKNISLEFPRNTFVVFTGVSGSGKSSLAFDTIYAEGQRRFVESLSAYARQFLSRMAKPDVDHIAGLAPAIAIEQKTVTKNTRSTVATTTEVYDYLRLLFARIGITICRRCGSQVVKDTPRTVQQSLAEKFADGTRFYVLFPMHQHEQRSLDDEIEALRARGFFRVVLDHDPDRIIDLNSETVPEGTTKSEVFVLSDRLVYRSDDAKMQTRLADAVESALHEAEGQVVIQVIGNDGGVPDDQKRLHFSARYECAQCGIRYEEPSPKLFSFNNSFGACSECEGFGKAVGIDMDLVIPDRTKTLRFSAIAPFTTPKFLEHQRMLVAVAKEAGLGLDTPINKLSQQEMDVVMNGYGPYIGVNGFFKLVEEQIQKMHYRILRSRYRGYTTCPRCKGSRLRTSATQVFVHGKAIHNITAMTIAEADKWINGLELNPTEEAIAHRIRDEIVKRLRYLNQVGLGYIRLDRLSHTLSGGESQRITLATSIGSSLVGAMYVLDEPSIGLHPRDTDRLISILKSLRDLGNTVILVEHDPDIIRNADIVVDMGPRAGEHGGEIVFKGSVAEMLADEKSLTGAYLSGRIKMPKRKSRRKPSGKSIKLIGVNENNLKHINAEFPLGMLTVITGVSGSGKSSLIHDVLYPAVSHTIGGGARLPKTVKEVLGTEHIGGVQMIDQTPIGRSPRSNPVTYIGAFDAIRDVFAATPIARQRGWRSGYFSFNVPGGRCETCQGEGVVTIQMQFLADLQLPCEACKGKRFKAETLQATFRGKNVVDVLEMTVDEAAEFFKEQKRIAPKLKALQDVGLGYIRIGQPATTLSGGEAQRVKLASQLVMPESSGTLFILDEPTTGLHSADIAALLQSFDALVTAGHSLIVIEHNLDVIRAADWVIDLGPEGGDAGGNIVCTGTPEQIMDCSKSYTGKFLKSSS